MLSMRDMFQIQLQKQVENQGIEKTDHANIKKKKRTGVATLTSDKQILRQKLLIEKDIL